MNHHLPENYTDKTICILGLGFVGLTLAVVLAEVGFDVVGVELRDQVREQISSGEAHFHEPGLTDNIRRALANGRLSVHGTIPEDCQAKVYIITVGTPLGTDGRVNLDSVRRIAGQIRDRLKSDELIVLRSTVKIGTTNDVVRPILEEAGTPFELAFCPERTVEGQALAELRYLPQIIGAAERHTVNRAAQLFSFITPTVVRVRSAETAEMIKLVDNTKRDVMFGFANEVARMCDEIGISAAEVIRSGRFGYSRTDMPMPGPVGGPCLSKDPHILAESLEKYNFVPEITLAGRHANERLASEITAFLKGFGSRKGSVPTKLKIALLGIAFKGQPVTDDVRGTPAIDIHRALMSAFSTAEFVAYDPVVDAPSLQAIGMTPAPTIENALEGANFALILNNHSAFASMPIEFLSATMAPQALIYDCWNNFIDRPIVLRNEVSYVALGSHNRPLAG